MKLTWKPIVGFEGMYEISNNGDIRSLPRKNQRRLILRKLTLNQCGYLVTSLSRNNINHFVQAHREVLKSFTGNVGEQANHKNGVKTDNRIENLEWCTRLENMHHRMKNKITPMKITVEQVPIIKARYDAGETQVALAEELGVTQSHISKIIHGVSHAIALTL